MIKNVLVYTHNSIYESTFAINCDSLVDKPQYKYSLEKFAMPASSLKNCLKKWEEVYEQKCGEAVEVKLIGVFPPIERMDNSLTKLEMCEKLSLSTNMISMINNLQNMKSLKILSLGRNLVKILALLKSSGSHTTGLKS